MTSLTSSRSGAGAPIVLVHGLGGRRSSWDPVLAGLRDAREVVTVDLPATADPPGRPVTLDGSSTSCAAS
jgi:pimeloyl-ACP methyl ester carboxylesterase